jgi:NADH:ubiquinone oxidoreductase subunit 6 (subunit J)
LSEIIFILSIVTIIFAYYSLETEDRLHSIVSLGFATISTGCIFLYLGAIYVAVFHLVVYSGVMTVLFAAIAHFVTDESIEPEEQMEINEELKKEEEKDEL